MIANPLSSILHYQCCCSSSSVPSSGVSVLGLISCTLLGIAYSVIPKHGRGASAVVTPVVLILQFTSGWFSVRFSPWCSSSGLRAVHADREDDTSLDLAGVNHFSEVVLNAYIGNCLQLRLEPICVRFFIARHLVKD